MPWPRLPVPLLAALLAFAVAAGGAAPPAGADDARWAEGRRAYQAAGGTGCAVCHGEYGANELGLAPVVRGADAARIRASLVTMETMTFLQGTLTDEEIEAMADYLAHLGTMAPTIVTRRRGVLQPDVGTVPAGRHVQLILVNQDRGACTWSTTGAGAASAVVAGRATGAVEWVSGGAGAALEAYCEEEPDMRVRLRVE